MWNETWNEIARLGASATKRASSWDRTGGNADWVSIAPGETRVLAEIDGPGVINHIYITMIRPYFLDYRDAILRMFWDGEDTPSVEAPIGDFFCVGNCTVRRFASLRMVVNPGSGSLMHHNNGFNSYFPMPFANGARIEIENQGDHIFGGIAGALWYHIDYETYFAAPPEDMGRFHAQWRRENLTTAVPRDVSKHLNLTGDENYVMLDAGGQGHVAGLFLQVNNVQGGWYGEGDDMIFVDGEKWPPSQHGTGTEEVFGGGAGPNLEYAGPYTGFLHVENKGGQDYKGKNAMYRWYVRDPIRFRRSIRISVEHGHGNIAANDYASVAYWYQTEPHAAFPELPPFEARRPIFPEAFYRAMDAYEALVNGFVPFCRRLARKEVRRPEWLPRIHENVRSAHTALAEADYGTAERIYKESLLLIEENGGLK